MKKKAKTITFELTARQRLVIAPVMLQSLTASEDGKPGLVLAQIINGEAKVGFVSHEKAKQIVELMGGDVNHRISDFSGEYRNAAVTDIAADVAALQSANGETA